MLAYFSNWSVKMDDRECTHWKSVLGHQWIMNCLLTSFIYPHSSLSTHTLHQPEKYWVAIWLMFATLLRINYSKLFNADVLLRIQIYELNMIKFNLGQQQGKKKFLKGLQTFFHKKIYPFQYFIRFSSPTHKYLIVERKYCGLYPYHIQ